MFYALLLGCLGLAASSAMSEASYRRRIENGRILIRKVWVGDIGDQLWQATDLLTPAAVLNAAWMLDLCLDAEDTQARVDGGFFKYVFVSQLAGDDHCFAEFARVGDGWVMQRAFRASNQRISDIQRAALDQAAAALSAPGSPASMILEGGVEEVEEVVDVRLPPVLELPEPPLTEDDLLLDELEAMEVDEIDLDPFGQNAEGTEVQEPSSLWPWDLPPEDDVMRIMPVDDEIEAIEQGSATPQGQMVVRSVPLGED